MNRDSIKQIYKIIAALLFPLLVFTQLQSVSAQGIANSWSDPYNLSKSGSTTDPSVVVDSTGIIHAVWQDKFAGSVYSRFEPDNGWSEPQAMFFPFSAGGASALTPITLMSDKEGFIHAFWIGQGNTLYHSSVAEGHFGSSSSWAEPRVFARFVSGFDVQLDDLGNFHVAYVKSQDEEGVLAGVYYQQLKGGVSWLSKVPIYLSPYFRSEGNETRQHVDISTTSTANATRVFIGYDDPARNQVSIRRSDDNGDTWSEPFDVARTDETASGGKPFGILVAPQGDNALVIWQTGVPEESCSTSYIWSTDSGVSWSEPQSLLGNLPGCPSQNQFYESSNGTVILMTTILDQVYLLAWNGVQWSDPQVQDSLNSFKDPISNNLVTLSCRQSTLSDDDRLYYAGCDPNGTGDIWILNRLLGSVPDWFPPEPVWSKPAMVASNALGIFKPVSIADSSGRIHVFWTQEDRADSGDRIIPIYYTSTSENAWLTPIKILNSPDGNAENLQVAIDGKDRLYLVWNGHHSGEIYFSWASADQASNPTEWEAPAILPSVEPLNNSPTIIASPSGNIFVAYALTLNENRGIYMVSSSDVGENWESPRLVVDAVAAGMNMVDNPTLIQTASGRLQLIFTQNAIPGDRNPIAMFYVSSDNEGDTWSQPFPIVEHPLGWFDMISPDAVQVHQLWQGVVGDVTSIWQEFSRDEGETWSQPADVTNYGGLGGLVDVVYDGAERLHLVQIVDVPGRGKSLKHWIYEGGNWSVQDDTSFAFPADTDVNFIDALATNDGRLITFFITEQNFVVDEQMPFQLLFSERIISLPLVSPTPEVIQTLAPNPTATFTPESTATEEPLPTTSPTPVAGIAESSSRPLNISMIGLVAGWFVILALVVGAFVFELRRRRK